MRKITQNNDNTATFALFNFAKQLKKRTFARNIKQNTIIIH